MGQTNKQTNKQNSIYDVVVVIMTAGAAVGRLEEHCKPAPTRSLSSFLTGGGGGAGSIFRWLQCLRTVDFFKLFIYLFN